MVKRDFPECAPVSYSQWTQPDACMLKTVGGIGFWVPENVTFLESGFYNNTERIAWTNFQELGAF